MKPYRAHNTTEIITNKRLIDYLEALTRALKGYDDDLEINAGKKLPCCCIYTLKFGNAGFIDLDVVLDGLAEEQEHKNRRSTK